jgi:hypothetical protein
MDLSTTKYGRLKYTIKLADIVALGAATSGDITLDTLPPGAVITRYFIKPSTSIAGGTISAVTARPKLNTTAIGAGTTNAFTTTGAIDTTGGKDSLTGNNVLKLTLVSTGDNLNAATAGQIDVVIDYSVLGL